MNKTVTALALLVWAASASAANENVVWEKGFSGYCDDLTMLNDGKQLALRNGAYVKLFDTKNGSLIKSLKNERSVNAFAVSPKGDKIIAGTDYGVRNIWDVKQGKIIQTLTAQKGDIVAMGYSPDGKLAASGSDFESVRIWNVAATQGLHTLETDHPYNLIFSPKGDKLLVRGYRKSDIYNVANGQKESTLWGNLRGVTWAFDDYVLAGAENNIEVRSLKNGKLAQLPGDSGPAIYIGAEGNINSTAFAAAGQAVIGGGNSEKLYLWEIGSSELLKTIDYHTDTIVGVASFPKESGAFYSLESDCRLVKWRFNGLDTKFRQTFTAAVNNASTPGDKVKVYSDYADELIFKEDIAKREALFDQALTLTLLDAGEQTKAAELLEIYVSFSKIAETPSHQAQLAQLHQKVIETRAAELLLLTDHKRLIEGYAELNALASTDEERAMMAEYATQAMSRSLVADNLVLTDKVDIFNRWNDALIPEHASVALSIMKSVFQIDIRHVFKEGRIGQRWVPSLSHTTASTKTHYINGNPINETTYDKYSTGGYDEDRYGYTNIYQLFNESQSNYLIGVEISASGTFSHYQTGTSWGGDEHRDLKSEKTEVREQFELLLKPGDQVKDQVTVGEELPDDFVLRVSSLVLLSDDWISGLNTALSGDSLEQILRYIADENATKWLPDLGGAFAQAATMNIDYTIETEQKFDRDFTSNVKVTLANRNAIPVKVTLEPNFIEPQNKIVRTLAANSEQTLNLTAKGVSKERLDIGLRYVEPDMDLDAIWTKHDLASLYQDLGRLAVSYDEDVEKRVSMRAKRLIRQLPDEFAFDWIDAAPSSKEALNYLLALAKTKDAEALKVLIKQVWQRHSDNASVLNNVAWYLQEIGMLNEAKQLAEQAIILAPNDPHALDTAGHIRSQLGDLSGIPLLEKASKLAPRNKVIAANLERAKADRANQYVRVKSVTASSVYPADRSSYYPKYAADANHSTAWFPNRTEKANRGEWIKFEFDKATNIDQMTILNGWVRDYGIWQRNSRVKTLTVELSCGKKAQITLQDSREEQTFSLPKCSATWVKLTIGDIYAGRLWNQEAGITEVNFLPAK